MAIKVILFLAEVFLIKAISSQCLSNAEILTPIHADGIADSYLGPNMPIGSNVPANLPIPLSNVAFGSNIVSNMANNLALGTNWPTPRFSGLGSLSAMPAISNGGCFTVTSSSPIAPTGLTVNSENAIEGSLLVSGQLPFLGSVAMDGGFSSTGGGLVSYGCGDGNIGMLNEGIPAVFSGPTLNSNVGYGTGISNQYNSLPGRGYNGLY